MSLSAEIGKKVSRMVDDGQEVTEIRMNTRTLGHLAEVGKRQPSFVNAYKVPEIMTDQAPDLLVSVDPDENHLNIERRQPSEMRKQNERAKVVARMLPGKWFYTDKRGRKVYIPINLDEKIADDEFTVISRKVSHLIDWRTGRMYAG